MEAEKMAGNIGIKLTLNDGNKMPQFGLGCFRSVGETGVNAVKWAAEAGYRHFDTATRYENERDTGRGIRECGVAREELFVVSKIWPTKFNDPQVAIEFSLKELDVGYIDAYLLHWPGTNRELRLKAWEQMLNYRQKGLIKSLGVSNFQKDHLEDLINEFDVVPVCNQIELHPWYQERELSAFCREKGIQVTAWGPIFRGHIDEEPLMFELAEKYGKSPVQVTLRWHVQKGNIVIPKSSNRGRIFENADIFNFTLLPEDMEKIDNLDCGKNFGDDPYTFEGIGF
jgi:diketogulonate reductase-like aldo/keto reductase